MRPGNIDCITSRTTHWLVLIIAAVTVGNCAPTVIFDMNTARHNPTTTGDDKHPIGTIETVPGKVDEGCLFSFEDNARSGFFTAGVRPSPDWDKSGGISMWVKGDGSESWGGMELIDASNYAMRYGYCFPIDSTEWQKITIPWCDFVPELPAGQPIDPKAGYAPSGLGNLWFGKWFYWGDYPAHSFTVDEIALESEIPVDETDYTPDEPGTPRLLAKLKAGGPVTVVTMGDSLSDKRHWANRETLWSEVLVENLGGKFGGEVKLVNPAIGGTLLTQNLVLMPRWLKHTPAPDLVTVWFGFNDWDSGMRGEHFKQMLRFAVDRIRRMTGGKSEIMLITTCPSVARWDAMEELAEAVRVVAAEKKTGLADVAAAFHQEGRSEEARPALYCSDKTHLSASGHQLAAKTVASTIVENLQPGASEPGETPQADANRHPVPKEHPRLLGSREDLQRLARERADAYKRVVAVARDQNADEWARQVSMSLVCAIERDAELGRQAIQMALKTIEGPIRQGHVTFAHDLARCALVYDLCFEYWTDEQRAAFHDYVNKTVDANVQSETHVFHNGWYGYKNWGIGLACYASYYENPASPGYLRTLENDLRSRAAPALELAGNGGGWAEGYYINYFLYEWLFFCEVARNCEGVDYYALSPSFFRNRAIASMFETYPGIRDYGSRRTMPMGDGGGRVFGGDRDKVLSARRILVNYYRDDPAHQVVHAFNEITPRSSVGVYAYKDFLWRDTTVTAGDPSAFKLSHFSPGPGYVYARSSWDDDATVFSFKCGDRFTAHQHLDVGNFLIFKREELVGDGGHYEAFGSVHDVNYHLRSIAHSTILVHDPDEKWPGIRAGKVTGNDGGQHHNWRHHNGAAVDPEDWNNGRETYEIGDITAFEDTGAYLYIAADCTRAYIPEKMDSFVRQIVFLRPGTFIIFDSVASTKPEFKKTWLLQAMKHPEGEPPNLTLTNGAGRLFVQMLLPRNANVALREGDDLYSYDGQSFPPQRDTGPAPECRIEVSPAQAAQRDYFLHVLTATAATVSSVEPAVMEEDATSVRVTVGQTSFTFRKDGPGGYAETGGDRRPLAEGIVE